jgi:hypothetical protein
MKIKILHLPAILLCLAPITGFAQTINLGTAAKKFVLFTTTGALSNTNIPRSQITGDVGTNSASAVTGFVNVNGVLQTPANTTTAQAEADLNNAVLQINNAVSGSPISGALGAPGAGQTLTPGVYDITGGSMLDGNLYLDGLTDPNASFIFRINGDFASAAAAKVKLKNGTQACNVYWRVNGTINLGTNTYMAGNLIANNAAIGLTAGDTLQGRAFTIVGAITTNGILAFIPAGCNELLPTGPALPVVGPAASCFAIFTKTGEVTNTDVTFVKGDIGTNSGGVGGYDPLNVTGTIHPAPDAATAACSGDLTTLYNYLNLLTPDIILNTPTEFGNNLVLTPHTYFLATATSLTDTVFLNAQGLPDAVFVIQMNGALTAAAQSYVKLINGAQAKNVFWLVKNAAATWGVNSVFNGSVIAGGAISTATNDSINGRLFTIAGAITTQASVVTAYTTLCGLTLPVKWLYFRGNPVQKNVLLEWGTTNEINNQFFTVEKSSDGIFYETLGTVNAIPGGADHKYSLLDGQPSAINFYRLSQTDIDGRRSYYTIIKVNRNAGAGLQASSYLQGNKIQVKLSGATPGNGSLILYSIEGKKISTAAIVITKDLNTYTITAPSQKGTYIINIRSAGGILYNGKIAVL